MSFLALVNENKKVQYSAVLANRGDYFKNPKNFEPQNYSKNPQNLNPQITLKTPKF